MLARLFAAATTLLLSLAARAEAPLKGGQAPGWYRMTLGKLEITALSDGTVQAPVDQLLRNIKPEQEKSLLARAYLKPLEVRDAMEVHLRHEPTKVSRSRIKRLRNLAQPQYRLRVGDIRVFYDVVEARVEILAILFKPMVDEWLQEVGRPL